jgi:hypothetical protein
MAIELGRIILFGKIMSRSYHVTRKQADKAMDAGDLGPTWESSEKAWVKKKEGEKRVLGKALKFRAKVPNRVITAVEKARTARCIAVSGAQANLDKFLAEKEEPNQSSQRNAMARPISVFESRSSRG